MTDNRTKIVNNIIKQISAVCLSMVLGALTLVTETDAALTEDQKQYVVETAREAVACGYDKIEIILPIDFTFSNNLSTRTRQATDFKNECNLDYLVWQGAMDGGALITDFAPLYSANRKEPYVTYLYNSSYDSLIYDFEEVSTENQAYSAALDALKNRLYNMYFTSDTDYSLIFELALRHHPEYDYRNALGTSTLLLDGTDDEHSKINLWRFSPDVYSSSKIKAMMKKADKKANKILKKIIKKSMTKKEKCKAIHDYIATHCEYSAGNANSCRTAYGCLVEKKAVCQGYTAAFNLLAKKAGIDSIAVTGTATNSSGDTEEHAWNMVRIGDDIFYIDVTWDDPVYKGTSAGSYVRDKYFMVDDVTMSSDHSWNPRNYVGKYVDYSK